MADFIRARSIEQKAERFEEIKNVAQEQFRRHPYHEITLTTIAKDLGWSRANLYKYVTTKEEIFLSLALEQCQSYLEALCTALPPDREFSPEAVAQIWTKIADDHRDYFRYGDILGSIVETNVSIEKLADFKRAYFKGAKKLSYQLASILHSDPHRMEHIIATIFYHGAGLSGWCSSGPIIEQALELAQIEHHKTDFSKEMEDFILMCITWNRS